MEMPKAMQPEMLMCMVTVLGGETTAAQAQVHLARHLAIRGAAQPHRRLPRARQHVHAA